MLRGRKLKQIKWVLDLANSSVHFGMTRIEVGAAHSLWLRGLSDNTSLVSVRDACNILMHINTGFPINTWQLVSPGEGTAHRKLRAMVWIGLFFFLLSGYIFSTFSMDKKQCIYSPTRLIINVFSVRSILFPLVKVLESRAWGIHEDARMQSFLFKVLFLQDLHCFLRKENLREPRCIEVNLLMF